METYSSILARKIPCTEEPGGLQFMGSQERDATKHAHTTPNCGKTMSVA